MATSTLGSGVNSVLACTYSCPAPRPHPTIAPQRVANFSHDFLQLLTGVWVGDCVTLGDRMRVCRWWRGRCKLATHCRYGRSCRTLTGDDFGCCPCYWRCRSPSRFLCWTELSRRTPGVETRTASMMQRHSGACTDTFDVCTSHAVTPYSISMSSTDSIHASLQH